MTAGCRHISCERRPAPSSSQCAPRPVMTPPPLLLSLQVPQRPGSLRAEHRPKATSKPRCKVADGRPGLRLLVPTGPQAVRTQESLQSSISGHSITPPLREDALTFIHHFISSSASRLARERLAGSGRAFCTLTAAPPPCTALSSVKTGCCHG